MRIAYFTAGTVGAGHLVRGIALGRALARRGFSGAYQMFGPPLSFAVALRGDYSPVSIAADEARDPSRAATSAVAEALHAFRPELLIVDMFWASLRHILPLPECECWLLIRSCPRNWLTGPADMPFAPSQFRRVIAIEPAQHSAIAERIDPIVVCNPEECRPPQALRARLGILPNRRLVAVMHAGVAGELAQIEREAGGEPVLFDLFAQEALFPLAEWLPGADQVYAGAGYNSFWEAQWLGYAARTRFTALPRRIDDQAWRIDTCSRYPMQRNGADTLAGSILGR